MVDYEKELRKLKDILKVPIDNIDFTRTGVTAGYVTVWYKMINIGTVPFVVGAAAIHTYDSSEPVVNKLEWKEIADQFKSEIHTKLFEAVNYKPYTTLGTFRKFYVRRNESDPEPILFDCQYQNNEWSVFRMR